MPPEGWEWDPTLFEGSAPYYEQGRLPYPSRFADVFASALGLTGDERLLDVGCGPGIVALRLAHVVGEVVGIDADIDFVTEAARRAEELGVGNVRFLNGFGEAVDLLDLGTFDVVTFAQSFHWMDRTRAATAARNVLVEGGAVVHVDGRTYYGVDVPTVELPHPRPPHDELGALVRRWLGDVRRAGQGYVRHGTPSGEPEVFASAGFTAPSTVVVPGGEVVVRTADDLVALVFSGSGAAPHLFGDELGAFEADVRTVLAEASPDGVFAEQLDDTDLAIYRVA